MTQLVGSPDGSRAAVLLASGDVVLVDPTDADPPRVVHSVRPPAPAVLDTIAVADDGRLAALAGAVAYAWDAAGAPLTPITTTGAGSGLAFRGDDLVRTVGDSVLTLADLPVLPDVGVGTACTVTLGATGCLPELGRTSLLATSAAPGGGSRVAFVFSSEIVWSDGGAGRPPTGGRLDPGLGLLLSVALAPDGRTAVVGGERGFALLALDGRNVLERSRVALGPETITGLVPAGVSPDGSRLVVLTGPVENMTSRVVDLTSGQAVSPAVRGGAGFLDDHTIVAGTIDPDGLRLSALDAATGAPTGDETLIPDFSPTAFVAVDAAGGRLVLAGRTGGRDTAVVIALDQNPKWRTLDQLGAFTSLALRPGHAEAWVVVEGRLERLDLATDEVENVTAAGDGLSGLAFSGDGQRLFLTAGPRVLALDPGADPPAVARLVGVLAGDASSVAADTTGARVAAVTGLGPVLLDTSTGESLLLGRTGAQQLDFLPDGDLLLVDGVDARVVALDPERAVEVACRVVGRVQTLEEWQRYGPQDAPYAPTCAAGT